MASRLREPFGKAGLIVAIVALVAALAGGAYAANSATDSKRNHKAKKKAKGVTVAQVRKIAKQEARKYANSNPGPAGPQGPAGANGNDGQNGSNGAQGDKGDQGDPGTPGADGKDGTFSTEPLPSEETLTGVWAASGNEGGVAWAPISFPIQVSPAPDLIWVQEPNLAYRLAAESPKESGFEFLETAAAIEAVCPGSASEPEAEPGNLCVYPQEVSGAESQAFGSTFFMTGPAEFGTAIVYDITADGGYARGTWAVTAL